MFFITSISRGTYFSQDPYLRAVEKALALKVNFPNKQFKWFESGAVISNSLLRSVEAGKLHYLFSVETS